MVYEADVWVADAAVFEENSTHWLSAGAKVKITYIGQNKADVQL